MAKIRIGDREYDQDTLRLTPRMGEKAPEFDVNTTHGPKKLGDYKGSWLLLFCHPADFTPVCTSELVAFAKAYDQFKLQGCDLLGLSVDSSFSHLAWVRSIEHRFDVRIPFPIVEDASMWVASMYGMIQPGASETSTVRATFVIDPEGLLRAMLYYPMEVGRSVAELLRLVAALRVCDQHKVVAPEAWQPGNKVLAAPPNTIDEIEAQAKADDGSIDWYYVEKSV